MIQDVASASMTMLFLLALWFLPVVLFSLTSRETGLARLNWALLLGILTWPAFALYLVQAGLRKR